MMIHKYNYFFIAMVVKVGFWIFQLIILLSFIMKFKQIISSFESTLLFISIEILIWVFTHIFPNIQTTQEGLFIQYFLWYIKIEWAEVISVEKTKYSRTIFSPASSWVIKVKKLPFIFNIIGLFTIYQWTPTIVISIGLRNYQQLFKDLSSYTNGRISV
jgi:hypothetical protein